MRLLRTWANASRAAAEMASPTVAITEEDNAFPSAATTDDLSGAQSAERVSFESATKPKKKTAMKKPWYAIQKVRVMTAFPYPYAQESERSLANCSLPTCAVLNVRPSLHAQDEKNALEQELKRLRAQKAL